MQGRHRIAALALVLASLTFFLASIAGFLNANIVNGERFAEHLNQMRHDPALAQAVGEQATGAVIDARPDLVAVQPAIQVAVATLLSSDVLNGVFTEAVASFHSALTQEGSSSAVLTIADLGASAVTLVEAVSPEIASKIPPDLDVTLAEVGGQEGLSASIIPLFQAITTLSWLLPLLALGLWILAVWLSPDRRMTLLRIGWSWLAVAAALAMLGLVGWVTSRLADPGALPDALLEAAADTFGRSLAIQVLVTAAIGGLLVVAASALLPQVHVHDRVRAAVRSALARPSNPGWAVARGLLLAAVGVGFVFFPAVALALVSVLVGAVIFLIGVAEIDLVAERTRPSAVGDAGGWRWAWLFPVVAGAVAVGLLALVMVPAVLPQPASAAADDPAACNGHVELCDRPFDQVAFPASHNSMSAADGPGWFLAEQPTGMVASLDDGIRVFLIDTWYGQPTESGGVVTAERSLARAQADFTGRDEALTPSMQRSIDRLRTEELGPERPYMCHTLCELGATELEPELEGLKAWMDEHPREVVTVFIQDAVSPADTAEVFERTGLADMAYVHQPGTPWPTLGEMISSGKRLLVLMENEGGGSKYPYLHQGFDVVQDTGYTYASVDEFDCAPNRGSADSDLLMVNHWLSSFTTLVTSAQAANTEEVLGERVRRCQDERGQIPNFVAVNWYDQGELLAVVDELNGFG